MTKLVTDQFCPRFDQNASIQQEKASQCSNELKLLSRASTQVFFFLVFEDNRMFFILKTKGGSRDLL